MKSFAISALIASVAAEAAFTCVNVTPAWAATTIEADATKVKDTATCKTECDAKAIDKTKDYCCMATTTAAADPADAAKPAAFACNLWELATVKDATIKKAKASTGTAAEGVVTYDAWSYNAGVMNAETAATEKAADSATMISSAIATIAAIAMVAY
jgi:hypothetical protein